MHIFLLVPRKGMIRRIKEGYEVPGTKNNSGISVLMKTEVQANKTSCSTSRGEKKGGFY